MSASTELLAGTPILLDGKEASIQGRKEQAGRRWYLVVVQRSQKTVWVPVGSDRIGVYEGEA